MVIGGHEAGEALLHLGVGEAQAIGGQFWVISLDGQVAALEEQGDGIVVHRVDGIQGLGSLLLDCESVERVVALFDHFGEEVGGSRGEPESVETQLFHGADQAERVVNLHRKVA